VTCPSPLPDGAKLYFAVTIGTASAVGSAELK
jgi:hypothetical protein